MYDTENAALQHAYDYAIKSLTLREQSEFEIRQKLNNKGFEQPVIDQVIEKLQEYHYIDDERFVEQYVTSHCHRMSKRQLEEKLYTKGIKNIDLSQYLTDAHYDEDQLIENLVNKYRKSLDIQVMEERNKIIMRIVQKGFSYNSVKRVVNGIIQGLEG